MAWHRMACPETHVVYCTGTRHGHRGLPSSNGAAATFLHDDMAEARRQTGFTTRWGRGGEGVDVVGQAGAKRRLTGRCFRDHAIKPCRQEGTTKANGTPRAAQGSSLKPSPCTFQATNKARHQPPVTRPSVTSCPAVLPSPDFLVSLPARAGNPIYAL